VIADHPIARSPILCRSPDREIADSSELHRVIQRDLLYHGQRRQHDVDDAGGPEPELQRRVRVCVPDDVSGATKQLTIRRERPAIASTTVSPLRRARAAGRPQRVDAGAEAPPRRLVDEPREREAGRALRLPRGLPCEPAARRAPTTRRRAAIR